MLQGGELALEQPALGVGGVELEGAAVGARRLIRAPDALQEVCAGGVEVAVLVQRQSVDDRQSRLRPLRLGDGDRPVELHHRRGRQMRQLAVERGDLRPVAWLLGVQGGDGRLDHVGAVAAQRQRAVERLPALGDLAAVPQ